MKEKYRIKEVECKNGKKFYIPQYSIFGIFWVSWLGVGMIDEYYNKKTFYTYKEAREFIDKKIEDKYSRGEYKVVNERIIEY